MIESIEGIEKGVLKGLDNSGNNDKAKYMVKF